MAFDPNESKAPEDAVAALLGERFHGLTAARADASPAEVARAAAALGLARPVHMAVATGPGSAWRDELRSELKPHLAAHVMRAARLARQAFAVTDALASQGVAHIPYKGAFLSLDLFGDAEVRASTDIDILLPGGRRDLAAALEALAPLGYRLRESEAEVLEYHLEELGEADAVCEGLPSVDLHVRPYSDLPRRAFAEAFARSSVAGSPALRRLRPADLFGLLSVHYWGQSRGSLKWLFDCAVLAARFSDEDRADLATVARAWRCGLQIAATLASCAAVFGPFPEARAAVGAVADSLTPQARMLALRVLELGPEAVGFGAVQKCHRLSLPSRRRLEAVRRFLWPRKGKLAIERRGRIGYLFTRIAQGLKAR